MSAQICYGDPSCDCTGFDAKPGEIWTCLNCLHIHSYHSPSAATPPVQATQDCFGESDCPCTGFVSASGGLAECDMCGHLYAMHTLS